MPAPKIVANANVMADYVATMLKHNVAGWQLAIAQNGKLAVSRAGGVATATEKIDTTA